MIIDTHAHIYSPDEDSYPTTSEPLRPPVGTGSPEHLRQAMAAAGVDRAVLIQTSTFYRWDNRFVRDTSAEARDWAVGVCTLNPDDSMSPEVLYALVDRSNVRGLRSVPAADGRYDHPGVRRLWGEAMRVGIVVNSLIRLEVADQLASLLDDHPDLRVVVDHGLALSRGPEYDATVARMVELARYPNLHAKLTFIPTGSAGRYPFEDMHDACKRFIEAYGLSAVSGGRTSPRSCGAQRSPTRGIWTSSVRSLG